MSKIRNLASTAINKVSELTYASTPYIGAIWKAISTGNILEASPLALAATAKEHYFQYTELIKDAERASSYVNSTSLYIDYLESKSVCNLNSLKKAFSDLNDLVKTLQNDKGLRDQLNKQQIMLNATLEDYNKSHNVDKYIEKVQTMSEKMFVKSWPGWYRMELNSQVNRMNMLLDETMIELSQKDKKGCAAKVKIPAVKVPEPISLDVQDEEVFYDALQQHNQQRGGAKKRKARTVRK